jgi:hypothetical protein
MRVEEPEMRPENLQRLVAPVGSDIGRRAAVGELTLTCQFPWGQPTLFEDATGKERPRRYRVCDGRSWGAPTTALSLAAAQARAVALGGRTALVWADDGTGVTVTSTPGGGFAVEATANTSWALPCQTLLDRHG